MTTSKRKNEWKKEKMTQVDFSNLSCLFCFIFLFFLVSWADVDEDHRGARAWHSSFCLSGMLPPVALLEVPSLATPGTTWKINKIKGNSNTQVLSVDTKRWRSIWSVENLKLACSDVACIWLEDKYSCTCFFALFDMCHRLPHCSSWCFFLLCCRAMYLSFFIFCCSLRKFFLSYALCS